MENEIWKELPFGDRKYLISNYGRAKTFYSCPEGKLMSQCKDRLGYLKIGLRVNGKGKRFLVHRLVGLVFVPNPFMYREINHKDGNKENNYYENLEWCTRSQNVKHAFDTGLKVNKKGDDHPCAKSFYQFDLKGNLIREWKSVSGCARALLPELRQCTKGVYELRSYIDANLTGRSKTCCGYIFSYNSSVDANEHKWIRNNTPIVGVNKKTGEKLYFDSFHDADGFVTSDGHKLSGTLICACIKGRGRSSHAGYLWSYK